MYKQPASFMYKWLLCGVMAMVGLGSAAPALAKDAGAGVKVTADQAQRRVDVTIDGKPFTSYLWPENMKKAVLYPLIAPDGITVSRGYPLEPRKGERVDHPHHVGMWFNYGNVNGFDFWNNSNAIKPENREKMGSIHHEKIISTKSGPNKGDLVVESVWITGKNQPIIRETTRFVFSKQGDDRVIDRITTLHALEQIVFKDDKEGVLGIRVAHFLESPTEKGGIFADASGRPTRVAAGDTAGATGVYLTSEGVKGDKVWSTRGRWCELTGNTDGKTETIAIIDNPKNPDYPTYWHARGYGLFAANPLGRHIFDATQPPLNFTIDKGKSVTFRFRVIIASHAITSEQMNQAADAFAKAYK